jgi:hypothetical protein
MIPGTFAARAWVSSLFRIGENAGAVFGLRRALHHFLFTSI